MRNPSSASPATMSNSKSTATPCCSKVGLKKGPWTPEEDELLANYVKREGEGRWRTLPKRAGLLRCGKSCRLRWMNYLRPSVKRGRIAPDEEDLILRLHRLLGNRWALIAGRIPGRTDNEIKNYWNSHLSKKLINQGIDPRTHKPLDPNSCPNSSETVCTTVSNPNSSLKSYPSPNPKPSPNFSGSQQVCGNNLDQDLNPDVDNSHENLKNSDALMTNLESGHVNSSNEEDGMEFCNGDTFSSFLNSLINEDEFTDLQQPNVIAPSISSKHVTPSTQTFDLGPVWEVAL
ncbi:unnamed protein product [Ilex paraguariensis]|uniref:Uncharacterized protein n=1 Tax=Ilex paraguariensis TaxID=185542 RepID=A0ABC8RMW7_9AQUA